MKYLLEIHVKSNASREALEAVLEIVVNILQLLGVVVVLAGVAQEPADVSLGENDPEHDA